MQDWDCCAPLALTTTVNTLAATIAERLNDEELDFLSAVLVQIGDTMATISAQRAICRKREEKNGGERRA